VSSGDEKVKLRHRFPEDAAREALWSLDLEVTKLDPPAGEVFNHLDFSVEAPDGEHIGMCGLYNLTGDEVQLGIRIGRLYWNKGYGTDAVNLLACYAFFVLNVRRVWLKVLSHNARAIRCYEKCGFVNVGRLSLSGYDFIVMEIRIT